MIQQLRIQVILLTDIKLKENPGKLNTYDKGIEGVVCTVPKPRTEVVEPSAKVTLEGKECGLNVVRKLGLPVIWSITLESMTHFEVEEIRHLFGLPSSAMAVIGGNEFFNVSWY